MMISKNQGGTARNTTLGVAGIMLGALMLVDAYFGEFAKESSMTNLVQYTLVPLLAIAGFGVIAKDTVTRDLELACGHLHGL
jgi:hypothetical protein